MHGNYPAGVANRRSVDPHELRAAVAAVSAWLDGAPTEPARPELAAAVRLSLRTLAALAPGNSVEVRVPPFGVVQCVSGPRHTRGTPPNVVQADPGTWLRLATGRLSWPEAIDSGRITASGTRAAEIAALLPIVR